MTADYLHQQARTCLQWARDCFDLQTAARLRLMAQEFSAKAAEIEANARYEMELEPPPARDALTRSKLEAMLLEFLRAYPHCREATTVVVRRLTGNLQNGANWTLDSYNSGRALREHCDPALELIVPIVQHHFDMAPDA